jgi:fermentation-respiration switch protein FrsA (DUF1100 family)
MDKLVSFYSGPSIKLAGILELPEKPHKKLPCMVLCHGPTGGKHFLNPEVSSHLAAAGYAALRFDYRGFGESAGPAGRLIPSEQIEDICNAVTFAQQIPEVDPGRIGLFGAATGGSHVVSASALDPRVKVAVSVSGIGDCGRWLRGIRRYWEWVELEKKLEIDRVQRVLTGVSGLVDVREIIVHDPASVEHATRAEREGRLAPKREMSFESADALINYQPEQVAEKISPRAVMLACAEQDTLVPVEETQKMYDKAREPRKLLIVKGARHHDIYHAEAFEGMMAEIVAWIDRFLK